MDTYRLTEKGARNLPSMQRRLHSIGKEGILDYFLVWDLGNFGSRHYSELVGSNEGAFGDIMVTEPDIRSSVRRLYEAGYIEKVD